MRQVNEALRQARLAGGEEVTDEEEDEDEWAGIEDGDDNENADKKKPAVPEFVDHEEEYIDEEKYTTVTVEAVDIDREGMHALSGRHTSDSEESEADSDEDGEGDGATKKKKYKEGEASAEDGKDQKKKKEWPKKTKKKQFRYESKTERALARAKSKKGKKYGAF